MNVKINYQVLSVEYTLPKLYIKQQYCVSCAVHGRIVRARKVAERRIREYVRPQMKGVRGFRNRFVMVQERN